MCQNNIGPQQQLPEFIRHRAAAQILELCRSKKTQMFSHNYVRVCPKQQQQLYVGPEQHLTELCRPRTEVSRVFQAQSNSLQSYVGPKQKLAEQFRPRLLASYHNSLGSQQQLPVTQAQRSLAVSRDNQTQKILDVSKAMYSQRICYHSYLGPVKQFAEFCRPRTEVSRFIQAQSQQNFAGSQQKLPVM